MEQRLRELRLQLLSKETSNLTHHEALERAEVEFFFSLDFFFKTHGCLFLSASSSLSNSTFSPGAAPAGTKYLLSRTKDQILTRDEQLLPPLRAS